VVRDFTLAQSLQLSVGLIQSPYSAGNGGVFSGGEKWLGTKVDHTPPPFTAKVKDE